MKALLNILGIVAGISIGLSFAVYLFNVLSPASWCWIDKADAARCIFGCILMAALLLFICWLVAIGRDLGEGERRSHD